MCVVIVPFVLGTSLPLSVFVGASAGVMQELLLVYSFLIPHLSCEVVAFLL